MKTRLEHDIDTLLAALEADPATGLLVIEDSRINPIFKQPYSGHYYRIDAGDQTFMSRSLWGLRPAAP